MSGSTWSWVGTASTAWANASNWNFGSGSDSGAGYPQSGDTAVVTGPATNTLTFTGTELSDNTLDVSGGGVVAFDNGSTLDSGSNLDVSLGTVDVGAGVFEALGSINEVGPTGTLTLDITGTLVSSGTATDLGINDGAASTLNNGALVISGGSIEGDGIHINDGVATISTALDTSDEISVTGGSVDLTLTNPGAPQMQFNAASVGSTIKLEDPSVYTDGQFGGFATGDTLDLGTNTIGTIVYDNSGSGYGNLTVEDTGGNPILSAVMSGGDTNSFQSGTFAVGASGGTAGSFQVAQGSGDTLITEATGTIAPTASTWTWVGATGPYNSSANWTTSGSGNANGYPANGDSAVVPSGTVDISGASLDLANLTVGGVAAGGIALNGSGDLEVNNGLVMLGGSSLAIDGTSGMDLGTSGSYVAGAVNIEGGVSLVGSGVVYPAVVNNGVIASSNSASVAASSGGTLEISGSVSGTGLVVLGSGSTLELDSSVGGGQTVVFSSGAPEDLVLASPGTAFANTVSQFSNGDTIELGNGMTVTAASVVNANTIAVDFTAGGTAGVYDLTNVNFAGGATQNFTVGTDSDTGDSYFVMSGTVGTISVSPPAISGTAANEHDNDVSSIAAFSNVAITDPNSAQIETVTVTESAAADGTLTNLAGGSYNATTGVYTVSGSPTVVTAALDGLLFVPTYGQVAQGQTVTTHFTIGVTDTLGGSATDSTTSVIATAGGAQADINTVYSQILDRPADSGGSAYWQQQLANGTSMTTVKYDLAHSAEAQGDINTYYEDIVSRPVDAAGLAYWQQLLTSGTPLSFVEYDIAHSAEAQADINTLYERILSRPVDSGGLSYWQQLLSTGAPITTVESDIAHSGEAQSDLNALYQQILGRSVDSSGLAYWQQQLATGTSMATVTTDLAHSGEVQGDLTTAYQDAYSTTPNQGVLLTLESRLAAGATLSSVENSLNGPLIVDTVGGQAITDQSTDQPFAAAVVTDPNTGHTLTATITVTNASGTATDANGSLAGNNLYYDTPGVYTVQDSTTAALTSDLNSIVFTPTISTQSVTTDIGISISDTVATGSDNATTITAASVSSPSNMNFIYGSVGSDTLAATSGPDVFAENVSPQGNDTITGFNVAQDMVQLSAAMFANFAAVGSNMTNVSGSAVIHIDSNDSITLQGVNTSSLQADNFRFV